MRHLDAIGAFCRTFSLTGVLCEPSESLVPATVRNSSNKSPASK
jgi:hypothetical protein